MTFEEILSMLQDQIRLTPKSERGAASWSYEEGVLMTANEAEFIIKNCLNKLKVRAVLRKHLKPADDNSTKKVDEIYKELGL